MKTNDWINGGSAATKKQLNNSKHFGAPTVARNKETVKKHQRPMPGGPETQKRQGTEHRAQEKKTVMKAKGAERLQQSL